MGQILKKNLSTSTIVFVLLFVWTMAGCSKAQKEDSSEEELLHFFEQELTLIKDYSKNKDAYLNYLMHQQKNYSVKQARLNAMIERINSSFDGIPEEKKVRYQRRWKEKFQPVINEMSHVMRQIIVTETAGLDPQKMAKIQQLTIELKDSESTAKKIELKPLFFNDPEE